MGMGNHMKVVRILILSAFLGAAAAQAFAAPTFAKDVAPIFFQHCAMCHRPGQNAPMSLLTYEDARPWTKSIAKAVREQTMPPWSGESQRHKWQGDLSLSEAQIATIVDRREAIHYAIDRSGPGDLVLIAGKGHEKYQDIGGRTQPFDDVQVAREALEARRVRSRVG